MEIAISKKVTQIKHIVQELKASTTPDSERYSPQRDHDNLKRHYEEKLSAYSSQDEFKWINWPRKTESILNTIRKDLRSNKNHKRRVENKERKNIKAASRAIDSGSVVILVEEDIPLGAIALLGKGLGYVPTPAIDKVGARLDMKLLTNKILNKSNINLHSKSHPNQPSESYSLPSKLRKNNYSSVLPSSDDVVNETVIRMKSGLDEKLRRPP